MNKSILTGVLLLAAVPVSASEVVPLPRFDAIELKGGGQVVIRHGPAQRVTLVQGSREMTGFSVDDGSLEIETCMRSCRDYDLRVEIVTPDLDAVAIRGGGDIDVEGRFPGQRELAVAISGGGLIDARAIPAETVAASIQGGGDIRTHARERLAASINGGGSIQYVGDPERSVAINGGGSVSPVRSR